jgi:outer membrane receptor protein involved in Fe transport
VAPSFSPLKPDTLKNYELGAKSDLWDGRISMEAALFYIDWTEVQQTLGIPIGHNVVLTALVNGTAASGPGADFAVVLKPVDRLEVGFNMDWNDLTWDSSIYSGGYLYAAKGQRLSYSPEYTAGASATYVFPLPASRLKGRLSLAGNYTSKQLFRFDAGGGNIVDAPGDNMLLTRASLSVDAPDHWTATLYADNIDDARGAYVTEIYGFTAGDWSTHPRPRTIGMRLDYRF